MSGLRRSYGAIVAVDQVSFALFPGEVVCLIGPNGAGKTTTMECIVGLRRADAGSITVEGHPASSFEARRLVGLVAEDPALFRFS